MYDKKQVLRIQKLNDRECSTMNCENTGDHTRIQDYMTTGIQKL